MAGANVPGIEGTPQFSENVPGVQFPFRQEFGRFGAGLEHLGEGIEGAARQGSEVYDEIQRQHDISTATQHSVDAGVAHAQKLQQLKLTSPDGFIHDTDTGEVVKNRDGTQRTLAQEYWDWADSDYQERQNSMSARAAAMFRQQMQPEIGKNTNLLQNLQLLKQRDSSDQALASSMSTMAHDNDRSPWPDANPYYGDAREDGSINLRGNTAKIEDQLRTIKLWTQRQGPLAGKAGMYAPEEVQKLMGQRLSDHADTWVRSAVTDVMENDTPRDHKNRVSTTAMQQVLNLRDIIEGKDPQSVRSNAKGLPTVNSSLTTEQIDRWRNQLNTMLDGSKKIDRSDYDFHLEEVKQNAKSGRYDTPDKLFRSPEFAYLIHAAEPLGMPAEEQLKHMSEIFSNAAGASYGGGAFDLGSEATKQKQIMLRMGEYAKAWPQYGGMLGAKFTGDMAGALIADATKGAIAKLKEEDKQYREDPAKFAAEPASGYQDPTQGIKYRSPTMKAVQDRLYSDPSLFAPLKPMSNGQPLITNAVKEMKRIGAMGFGAGFEPSYLSKDDYQAWASKIDKSGNPEQLEQMFQQLKKASPRDAGTVMDQLVKVGNLDPRYQVAQNLPTSVSRIAAYADIMSKGAAIEMYTKSEGGESMTQVIQKAHKANQDLHDYSNRLYGADSPEGSKNAKMLDQTWASAYSAAMGVKGTSQSEAAQAANERVRAMIPPVSTVQGQHNFLGLKFGSAGPASRVQFSRPDLSSDQQETIQQNLLKAQSLEELQKYEPVPVPIKSGAYDFNKKLTPKWIAEHPFVWYPVNGAYRLQYQGMNADGSPNGRGYDLKVHGPEGAIRYYEVKESDALKKPGQ